MLEFSNTEVVGKYEVRQEVKLSADDICNIVVGALEGGINHWASLKWTPNMEKKPKDEPISTWVTKLLLEKETVLFYDTEDEADGYFVLTLNFLLRGIQQNAKERPHDADLDNADAITYNCIFQYALFEEIIYS